MKIIQIGDLVVNTSEGIFKALPQKLILFLVIAKIQKGIYDTNLIDFNISYKTQIEQLLRFIDRSPYYRFVLHENEIKVVE